jgi:transposase
MTKGATRWKEGTPFGVVLHVACELDDQGWKLAFGTVLGKRPWLRRVSPRDRQGILAAMEAAKARFGLEADARVVSCYEAGREGFWLHRWLEAEGVANRVVDSSSIEVNRRARRAKTDRLDAKKLLRQLMRHEAGERKVWSVLRVPTEAAEDARHLHRELVAVKRDRVRVTNRIQGLLATQGVKVTPKADFLDRLAGVERWDGSPLPAGIRSRIERAWEQREWLTARIRELEGERRELLRTSEAKHVEKVRQLMELSGIGENSAWTFVTELFGWRKFRNRREVAAAVGLAPTPYDSGSTRREQGISRAGNRTVRWMAVQIAWAWLRHQPNSEPSRWYNRRFGQGGPRMKKVGVVALARKLIIELWQYVETGALPEGATLKA